MFKDGKSGKVERRATVRLDRATQGMSDGVDGTLRGPPAQMFICFLGRKKSREGSKGDH
jgi:hypothetical protein